MPRYYQSVFTPPAPPPAGTPTPARQGWEAVTPATPPRAATRQQPLPDAVFRPVPVPQGWDAVVPATTRRVQPRQQPDPDQRLVRIVPAQPAGRDGWQPATPPVPRPRRQQPAADAGAVYPPTAGSVTPGATPRGWEATTGQPGRPLARRQPDHDGFAFRVPPAPQPAGRDGWQPATAQTGRGRGRQQPAGDPLVFRPAAVAAVVVPQGWDAVGGGYRRPAAARQTAGTSELTLAVSAAVSGEPGTALFFIW